MLSSFASQLQAIAQTSTNELDLKARRSAHAESLLFERDIAAKQDFGTIYNICSEGYRELCQLDDGFLAFERNLFSEQAKSQDREQMSKSENEALDLVLKRCFAMLGSRILLKPSVKALEWLVRRFRVHIYNVDDLLLTLLPYHEVSIWANALSIVPNDKIVGIWKFLRPYLKTTWNIPRHAVAHAASTHDAFFMRVNSHVLETCRQGLAYSTLMRFWSCIVVEAISHRLIQTRNGRKEVESQRTQDLLHKVLPLLSDAFEIPGSVDLITTCYTITIVLAAKAELADTILDSLLLAVAQSLQNADHDAAAAIITMSVIVGHKESSFVPKKVLEILADLEALSSVIRSAATQHDCGNLLLALVNSSAASMRRKNARKLNLLLESSIHLLSDLYSSVSISQVVKPVVEKAISLRGEGEAETMVRNEVIALLQRLNENEAYAQAISDIAAKELHDPALLEGLLGMTITLPEPAAKKRDADTLMTDAGQAQSEAADIFSNVPRTWDHGSSCLSIASPEPFRHLAEAFEKSHNDVSLLERFASLPLWDSVLQRQLAWQTFLLRSACANMSSHARIKALRLLSQAIAERPAFDIQFVVPYALNLLLSQSKAVRRAAAELLQQCRQSLSHSSPSGANAQGSNFYAQDATKTISPMQHQQVLAIISEVVMPNIEECVLDSSYASKAIQNAFNPHNKHDSRKGHAQAMFALLTQHALATPLVVVKVGILSMLAGVQKVGNKSKTKVLAPVVREWASLSDAEASEIAGESGLALVDIDMAIVGLLEVQDKHVLASIAQGGSLNAFTSRKGLVNAFFNYIRQDAKAWNSLQLLAVSETLFDLAFSPHNLLATGAQDVLRSIDLNSEVLASLLQSSQEGTSGIRIPSSKRRRRSSSGNSVSRSDAIKAVDIATSKIGLVLELVESNSPETKPELINDMFEMLATLKQLQQGHLESPYSLNLCLSSIAAMVNSTRSNIANIDLSGVKPELVTDCLRNSDNLQVQNESLLVLAALSTVVPDKMVHNVMPVFTFIGRNMLSKDDDHSINVINEAIDKIVPALLQNLRKGRNPHSYQTSLASMLASFTAAYDHIPHHRRVAFYQKLLLCVDANEAGYMLVALLADHHRGKGDFVKPLQELLGILVPSTQLLIYRQMLYLSVDVLTQTPKQAAIVFNTGRLTTATEKTQYSESTLYTAANIISSPSLVSAVNRLPKTSVSEQIVSDLQSSFESTLATIHDTKAAPIGVSNFAKQTLDKFLLLPSITQLLEIVTPRLDDMDAELRSQALRILALQVDRKPSKDSRAQAVALQLLSKLGEYIRSSDNLSILLASLSCVDRLVEAYGRRDPEAIVEVAQSIIESIEVQRGSDQQTTAQLLTLAGAIEVIKEAAVPLVPRSITKILSLLSAKNSVEDFSKPIWSAVCTLVATIFAHVAFMVPQNELSQILSFVMAGKAHIDTSAYNEDYATFTRSIARKVDLDVLVGASKTVLGSVPGNEAAFSANILSVLSQTLESATKSAVIRQADSISSLFLLLLDREASDSSMDDASGNQTMIGLKTASIKYIYKLNDTTFRPIFESWVDWSISDDSSLSSRQNVLFTLLTHFFDTLKAIVTSYAIYLLKPISSILSQGPSKPLSASSTLPVTLTLLRAMTSHDQDSFFAAPSHFDTLAQPLISCLTLAAHKSTRLLAYSQVIPTIVSLAISTLDSPSTHTTISSLLSKLKSHSSSHVRLASIQTLIAMTEDEELGDEFVSNVIGIGAGEGEGARGGGGSVGEIMVYVNEMLEDDDEDVEFNVRKWVQLVRGKVGEDVFEV